MMEMGTVVSADIMPAVAREFAKAAREGNALEESLKSNRVAQQQMTQAFQEQIDLVFRSGFGEGLTDVFKSLTDAIVDNKEGLVAFGRTMGGVFKALGSAVRVLSALLQPFGSLLDAVTGKLGSAGTIITILAATQIPMLANAFKVLNLAMVAPFAKLVLIAAVLEEILGFLGVIEVNTLLGKMTGINQGQKVEDRGLGGMFLAQSRAEGAGAIQNFGMLVAGTALENMLKVGEFFTDQDLVGQAKADIAAKMGTTVVYVNGVTTQEVVDKAVKVSEDKRVLNLASQMVPGG